MKRLKALSTRYNIGGRTLMDFLLAKGYVEPLTLSSKIEEPYLSFIDEEFRTQIDIKKKAQSVTFAKTKDDIQLDNLKSIPVGFAKRISIEIGSKLTYRDLFGACFYGVKKIVCIDPYIRNENQISNLGLLIKMVKDFSFNAIEFQLITCWDQKNHKEIIEKELDRIKKKVSHEKFSFEYKIEQPDLYHDRYIFVDNKYIVDLSRGLDIFKNFESIDNLITKSCTIFITRTK